MALVSWSPRPGPMQRACYSPYPKHLVRLREFTVLPGRFAEVAPKGAFPGSAQSLGLPAGPRAVPGPRAHCGLGSVSVSFMCVARGPVPVRWYVLVSRLCACPCFCV